MKATPKCFAACTWAMWLQQARADRQGLSPKPSTHEEKWSPTVLISFALPCGGKAILQGHRKILLIKMGNKHSEQ